MGVLRVNIGGEWVDISGNGGTDEVSVGAIEPTEPGVELWYDTEDTPELAGLLPAGGTLGQALVKKTAADYDTEWRSSYSVVAYSQVTANQTGIAANTLTNITGLSVTFTALANHRYRVSMHTQAVPGAPSTCIGFALDSGVVVAQDGSYMGVSANGLDLFPSRILVPVPGAHTYYGAIQIIAGTGNYMLANANVPTWLMVEDLGLV
jgi:hypothetical protein